MPHPFRAPIDIEPRAIKAAEVRCSCPSSPFCRGVQSVDWAACSTACKACRPALWQPPVRTSVFVERPEHLRGEHDG